MFDNVQPLRAECYRQTAEEIRQVARQSRFPEIGEELLQLADRFDLMAAHLERRANAREEAPPPGVGVLVGRSRPTGRRCRWRCANTDPLAALIRKR